MRTTMDLPPLQRGIAISSFDASENTIDLTWTSGAAVRRYDWRSGEYYDELLDVRPSAVRLDRLNNGAPLLDTHRSGDLDAVIGTIVPGSAYVAAGQGFAKAKLSARAEKVGVVQDISDGIIRNISVGYRIHKVEKTPARDGQVAQWRVTDWEPMEVSAVPIPADGGAQFRSEPPPDQRTNFAPCTFITHHTRDAEASDNPQKVNPMTIDTIERSNIRVGTEDREKRGEAMTAAILHRVFPKSFPISDAGREFRGMSLLEMARDSLAAQGTNVRGLSKMELATVAMDPGTYHRSPGDMSSGDFPNILANVANKSLQRGYSYAGQTFRPLVRETTVKDFKPVTRVLLGEAPPLELVPEHAEFKRGGMSDSGEGYALTTYGKIVGVTRQVLINDDLEALTRIPRAMGLQAAQLESDLVWSQFLSNPIMVQDGLALFHANHNNIASTGSAIATYSISAGRTAMARQTGRDGATVLNIDPAYLIVPKSLQTQAEQFVQQIFPTQMSQTVPDSLRRLQIISDARLDSGINRAGFPTIAGNLQQWYLAADPENVDCVELAYLEGSEGVYTQTRMGFEVDGMELKVRMDVAAKAIDFRGLYMNAGA